MIKKLSNSVHEWSKHVHNKSKVEDETALLKNQLIVHLCKWFNTSRRIFSLSRTVAFSNLSKIKMANGRHLKLNHPISGSQQRFMHQSQSEFRTWQNFMQNSVKGQETPKLYISCTSSGDGQTSCFWLTSVELEIRRFSNQAKTRNPLKFAEVPQTGKPISAANWPKFTILQGHVEDTLSSQMCTQLSTLIVHMSSVHKIVQLLLGSQGTSFH